MTSSSRSRSSARIRMSAPRTRAVTVAPGSRRLRHQSLRSGRPTVTRRASPLPAVAHGNRVRRPAAPARVREQQDTAAQQTVCRGAQHRADDRVRRVQDEPLQRCAVERVRGRGRHRPLTVSSPAMLDSPAAAGDLEPSLRPRDDRARDPGCPAARPGERVLRDRRVRARHGAARAASRRSPTDGSRGARPRSACSTTRCASSARCRSASRARHRARRGRRARLLRAVRSRSSRRGSRSSWRSSIVTYLSVVLGELVPKAIALHRAARVAAVVARPIALLQRVTAPLAWVLQGSARILLRPLGVPVAPGRRDRPHRRRAARHRRRGRGLRPDRGGRGGDALPHLRLRRPGGGRRDGPLVGGDLARRVADRARRRRAGARGAAQPLPGHPRLDRRRRGRRRAARPDDGAARRATSTRSSRSRASCSSCRRPRTSARCCRSCARAARRWRSSSASTGARWGSSRSTTSIEEIVGEIEEEYGLPDESVQELPDGRLRVSGTSRATTSTRPSTRASRRKTSARSAASCSPSSGARRAAATR